MKVRILLFKKSISRWKNVFVVWPTDVSTFRPLTVTPSAALRSVGHKPRTPMSNNIIITGGYFIVGDVIKIFSLKKNKTKNWIVCFFFNIWPISQQIDHSILFLIFCLLPRFILSAKEEEKKTQFFGYYFNLNFVRHPMSRSRTKSISPDNSKSITTK